MAQDLAPDDSDFGAWKAYDRWPNEAPTAAVTRVVLELDEAITLKRRAAAARFTAQGDAVPLRPIKPSRIELGVLIALAETYGVTLHQNARFVPLIDFIADSGAVASVQRVMYGALPEYDNSDDCPSALAQDNARLADLAPEARVAFELLCATWPDVFLAQAGTALATLGLPRLQPPPSTSRGADGDE
ncbi:hypothetical protein AWB74_07829 [Caballeronia arvi]|uniref:Uncharacterized protein n=1 Tax=Caballeronia arvi TaxID=1777135 RepID=A0A158L050_9BURK|nr:hypothetical protein [Caballeronia arvi]SAL86747.1 hypothetical protein AWB74_07829 [Caballeronia arvi]